MYHVVTRELFHGGGSYHIETSPLICRANQLTIDWFLFDKNLRHERINHKFSFPFHYACNLISTLVF